MRASHHAAVVAAAALVAGCGALDVEGPATPAPPSSLNVALASSSGGPELQMDWVRPPGPAPDAIVVQVRVGGGPWADAFWLPGQAESGTSYGAVQYPDGAQLTVRALAFDNGIRSTPSNEVSLQLPLLGAEYLMLGPDVDGTLYLSWEGASVSATGVRVERRLEPVVGEPGAWQVVLSEDVSPSTARQTFHDLDTGSWRDGARLAYRVVYVAPDVESAPAEIRSGGGRPLALTSSATVDAGSVHVAWTYGGIAPIDVKVTRRSPLGGDVELGVVSTPVTSFDDPSPAPGFYSYVVQAKNPDDGWYDYYRLSDPSSAPVVVADQSLSGLLEPSVRLMPSAVAVTRASSGEFALVWSDGNTVAVQVPTQGGWERWAPAPSAGLGWLRPARPGIHFDAQGHLHILYEVLGGDYAWDVRHRWQDGQGWQDEHAATIAATGAAASSSALDAQGVPHLLWQDCCGTGGTNLPMTYASRAGGSWTAATFGAPWETAWAQSPLATDPVGAAGFLAMSGSLLLLRESASGWTGDAVPTSDTTSATYRLVLLPAADRAVLVGLWSAADGTRIVGVRERTASGWGAADAAFTTADPWPALRAAISPDGARVAIATASPPSVAVRDASGWTLHALASPGGDVAVGFSPAGKLWVLLGIGGASPWIESPSLPHVLYEEP